ncbi:hypothetical protein G6M04_30310 [Agrobacterium rhizogenes]|uniref:hypothetical protein n=1 Tax=Rhizobium rhizogenes TaxID=359 RepID=UPI0015743A89|nr:hypothetical protein [Rhizobium rhizogenes]NTG51692.1 hypothetical protein [Rhizobium rhizogenes]
MTRYKSQTARAMLGAVVLLPAVAHASGRLPIPPVFEEFKSHSACIAALEAYFKEDQKQVRPKSAGNLPEVELITETAITTRSPTCSARAPRSASQVRIVLSTIIWSAIND